MTGDATSRRVTRDADAAPLPPRPPRRFDPAERPEARRAAEAATATGEPATFSARPAGRPAPRTGGVAPARPEPSPLEGRVALSGGASAALRLARVANRAADARFGAHPRPYVAGAASTYDLVADLEANGVDLAFAERKLPELVDTAGTRPTGLRYFAKPLVRAWQEHEATVGTRESPAEAAVREAGLAGMTFEEIPPKLREAIGLTRPPSPAGMRYLLAEAVMHEPTGDTWRAHGVPMPRLPK